MKLAFTLTMPGNNAWNGTRRARSCGAVETTTGGAMSIPYVAIGNNELGEALGATIECPRGCGERHPTENSQPSKQRDGSMSRGGLLQFYGCGGKTYLIGIEGRIIPRFAKMDPA